MLNPIELQHSPLFNEAWKLSRSLHGNTLTAHIPGMFIVNGRRGRFQAVSITGNDCLLQCEHCKGRLLTTMPHATTPENLLQFALNASKRGDKGLLITGGCDEKGRLPWSPFISAIEKIKSATDLKVTVHAGQVNVDTAKSLKNAGVDQALVDVIGDDETAEEVYHLDGGISRIRKTLDSLAHAGLEIVPHIIYGLYFGKESGENNALEILAEYPLQRYVVVVLMPFSGTPMTGISPPSPMDAAVFIAKARLRLPELKASLGCARPRGKYRRELDSLAVSTGVNSIALPSDRALETAADLGLEVRMFETCCSLAGTMEISAKPNTYEQT